MKVLFLCPSNKRVMPYLENYTNVVDEKIKATYIFWDRFGEMKNEDYIIYKDDKKSYRKNFFSYFKYIAFVLKQIRKEKPDKIIVFGLQLSFFLQFFLIIFYKNKYIIDIRDYNKVVKFIFKKWLFKNASFIVVSSVGFKKWLPSTNVVVNHNSGLFSIFDYKNYSIDTSKDTHINIAYIGAIRDADINISFVKALELSKKINIHYYGFGPAESEIRNYCDEKNLSNIEFFGKYQNLDSDKLYLASDMINILIPNSNINSKTLLPNRLYNAVLFAKPIVCFEGNYMSEIVREYNLGIVLSSFECLEDCIYNYYSNINHVEYENNRRTFIKMIEKDNTIFHHKLTQFVIE